MPSFNVNVRDKRTKQEMTLQVSGDHDADSAKKHVETMPASMGGSHQGFEVLGVEEIGAAKPVETHALSV
jgi:hypothetical protein